jgi:hypothetical protein
MVDGFADGSGGSGMVNRLGRCRCFVIAATTVIWVASILCARADEPFPARDQAFVPGSATGIALIDVGEVYKNCLKFRRDIQKMKSDLASWESQIRNDYERRRRRTEEILAERDKHAPGSSEFLRLDAEAESLRFAPLAVEMPTRKELILREAKIYFDTYEDICEAIREYADAHEIGLVLHHSREPVALNKAASLMRRVKQKVVCHNLPDITDEIIRRLTEQDAVSRAPAEHGFRDPPESSSPLE